MARTKVDAQLLEGVDRERLEAEEIDQAHEALLALRDAAALAHDADRVVHARDDPIEEAHEDRLRDRVAPALRR